MQHGVAPVHAGMATVVCRWRPQVVQGDAPVAAGCATVVCRWRPGGAPVTRRCYYTRLNQDKTWSKVSSLQSLSHNSNVFQENKKTPVMWCRSLWIEYLYHTKNLSRKPCRLRNHHQTTILQIAYLLPQCH